MEYISEVSDIQNSEFIKNNALCIDWQFVSQYHNFSDYELEIYERLIHWDIYCKYHKMTQAQIIKFSKNIELDNLLEHQNVSASTLFKIQYE